MEKVYQKTLHFLSFRPRSEKEIKDFLRKKTKDETVSKQIIFRLKEEKLVDDMEFVDWWIQQRMEFNPKGKAYLRQELLQKGIDRELINEKLDKISDETWLFAANKVVDKKAYLYIDLDLKDRKNKLTKLLLVRGFDYEVSKIAVDAHLQKR